MPFPGPAPSYSQSDLCDGPGQPHHAWALRLMAAGFNAFSPPIAYQLSAQGRASLRGMDKAEKAARAAKMATFKAQWAAAEEECLASAPGWGWVCSACVAADGKALVGKRCRVWWAEDERVYGGVIDAFDSPSGKHRV